MLSSLPILVRDVVGEEAADRPEYSSQVKHFLKSLQVVSSRCQNITQVLLVRSIASIFAVAPVLVAVRAISSLWWCRRRHGSWLGSRSRLGSCYRSRSRTSVVTTMISMY